MTVNFVRGNGVKVMLICKSGSAVDSFPIFNNTYTPSTVFGSGSQIGSGNYVMSTGSLASIDITGLSSSTTYHFFVSEYNGLASQEKYNINTASGNPANQITQAAVVAPTTQATNIVWTGDRKLSWTRGDGSFILIVMKLSAVDSNPADGSSYTANINLGSGSQIGSGNYVLYKGTGTSVEINPEVLAFATPYGVRAYEFNGANGSEKYKTSTATGNPLSHNTQADEAWYLYHDTPVTVLKTPYNNYIDSRSCTQMYAIGMDSNATYLYLYCVAEGDFDSGIDRSVRYRKTIADGLPITQGWAGEAFDANGDITSFLDRGPAGTWNAYQDWGLQSVVDLGGGSKYGYYTANKNSGGRYSVGLMTSADDGNTWVRDSQVIAETSGRSIFYFKAVKDGSTWRAIAQDYNLGEIVEGHLFSGGYWTSSDGKAWTKQSSSDIFANRGLSGAVDISQMWLDTGRWYAYLTINDPGITGGYTGNNPTNITTNPTGKIICLISWTDWANFNTDFIFERILFKDSQAVDIDVRAYCPKMTFSSQDYIWAMSFKWRGQTGLGAILEPVVISQLLTKGLVSGGGGQTLGREVYPDFATEIYIPHASYVTDSVGNTPVVPKKLFAGTSGTIVGSPKMARLNSIQAVDNGFVTFPNFNYDPSYFGVKVKAGQNALTTTYGICGMDSDSGTHGWHIRKAGIYQFEIWVYGSNSTWKRYKVNRNTYYNRLDKSGFDTIGFLWQNGVLKVCMDYKTDCTVTKTKDDIFTTVQQTDEVLRMGAIYPTATDEMYSQDVVGTMLFLNGVTNATESNWLNNDLV